MKHPFSATRPPLPGGSAPGLTKFFRILAILTGWHLAVPMQAEPFPEIPRDETAVVRGIMPDSYPGAFAVIFPDGPSLCFDPVRGGINAIWEGTAIDFRPNWTGKVGQPATIGGKRFYVETAEQPLRRGNPDEAPQFAFEGYHMRNGYPVFRYRIGDFSVREELRPLEGNRGVIRQFQTDAPGETFWLLTGAQDAAVCSSENGEWREGRLRVTADKSGAFTVTILRTEEAK